MKNLFSTLPFFIVLLLISACVPAKKYKDLLEREKVCSEELSKFKKSSGEYEALSKDLQTNLNTSQKDWDEKREKAYIVGYLQSTVDFAIIRLNSLVKN